MNWINKLLIKLGLKKTPKPMTTEELFDLMKQATERTNKKFLENIDKPLFEENELDK